MNGVRHKNPKMEEQRKFVRDYAIILINTGLRPTELRRVLWENVSVEQDEEKEPSKLAVQIKLDKTQTKTRKPRTIIGRRGDVFNRIKDYSKFTKPRDFVFYDNDTVEPIFKERFYTNWRFLIRELGYKKTKRDYGFYPLRHAYCTYRLQWGVDIFDLSESMGTSITMLQKHYAHVIMEMRGKELVKDVDLKETGGLVFD